MYKNTPVTANMTGWEFDSYRNYFFLFYRSGGKANHAQHTLPPEFIGK